ncbi:MAG TPA: MliC family protein [Gemmatimonadota bacterium]|nr:MliC family protein [Gemmatimonadota bacterium]
MMSRGHLLPVTLGSFAIALAAGCERGATQDASDVSGETAADPALAAPADTASSATKPASFSYGCGDEFRFVARLKDGGESVRLLLPDTALTLPHVVSASGAKYGEGPFVYWSQGEKARLDTPRRSFTDCVNDEGGPGWLDAKARGIHFRAVGQEPGWILDVRRDGGMDIQADYGEIALSLPSSEPETDRAGRTAYRAETESHWAAVVIDDVPCRDAMSGWPYESTVSMTLDGREYRGCGRWL